MTSEVAGFSESKVSAPRAVPGALVVMTIAATYHFAQRLFTQCPRSPRPRAASAIEVIAGMSGVPRASKASHGYGR